MSVFVIEQRDCADCGGPVELKAYDSVNADRHARFRAEILDGSFQRARCPSCGSEVRIQPTLTYFDAELGLFARALPFDEAPRWQEHELDVEELCEASFGYRAPASARAMIDGMQRRLVFGWAALREKLICRQQGLDDVSVELAKLVVMREIDGFEVGDEAALRLVGVVDDDLVFELSEGEAERVVAMASAPRTLLDEIEAEPALWSDLRDELAQAQYYIDVERTFLEDPPQADADADA